MPMMTQDGCWSLVLFKFVIFLSFFLTVGCKQESKQRSWEGLITLPWVEWSRAFSGIPSLSQHHKKKQKREETNNSRQISAFCEYLILWKAKSAEPTLSSFRIYPVFPCGCTKQRAIPMWLWGFNMQANWKEYWIWRKALGCLMASGIKAKERPSKERGEISPTKVLKSDFLTPASRFTIQ